MAPNIATCPACAARLKLAQPPAPGKRIKCPKCQTLFAVPQLPDGSEALSPAPSKAGKRTGPETPSAVGISASQTARRRPARDEDEDQDAVENGPRSRRRARHSDEDSDDDEVPVKPKSAKKKKSKKKASNPALLWGAIGGGAFVLVLAVVLILILNGAFGNGSGKQQASGNKSPSGSAQPPGQPGIPNSSGPGPIPNQPGQPPIPPPGPNGSGGPPKTGGGQIQISPEMQAFLAAMNGDANSVEAAFKKYAATDVKNPDNIYIYSLGSPNVIKKEQRENMVCYTVVTKAGVTTRTWEICWSGSQISAVKQLSLSFD